MSSENNNYIENKLGRCLTEYRHPLYGELLNDCIGFITVPIGSDPAGHLVSFDAKCFPMQECYGVLRESNKLVKLIYIIDSSD